MLQDCLLLTHGLILGWMVPRDGEVQTDCSIEPLFPHAGMGLEKTLELPCSTPRQPWLPNKPLEAWRNMKGSCSGHTTPLWRLLPGPKPAPELAIASLVTGSCTLAAAAPCKV